MHDVKPRTFLRLPAVVLLMGCSIAMMSCSEEPTEANSPVTPLLPLGKVVFHDTTVQATSSRSFLQYIPTNGQYNLVGKYGNYTAYALIQFYPSTFPARDSATVTSAVLTLHSHTRFGDSAAAFSFNVYRVIRPWQETTLIWSDIAGGYYDPGTPIGSFSAPAGPDSQEIDVQLNTDVVKDWLRTSSDTVTKDGIILVPTGTTNAVRGLNAFGTDSTYLLPKITITSTLDTATYVDSSASGIDTFVANIDNLATDPTLLYLQSGVTYRGTVVFDVSFIPKGAFVNSAQLILQRAPATQLINQYSIDSVEAHLRLSDTDSTNYEFYTLTYGTYASATPNTFSFDARHLVQSWVKGPNDGVLLANARASEARSLDLHTFYGARADSTRRPRLRILYSLAKP